MASFILYQNADQSVTLLDIPGSIEAAQGFEGDEQRRCLFSSPPTEKPYPKLTDKAAKLDTSSIQDLLLQGYQHFALEEIRGAYGASWCLPRTIRNEGIVDERKQCALNSREERVVSPPDGRHYSAAQSPYLHAETACDVFYNWRGATHSLEMGSQETTVYVPPQTIFILGDIENTLPTFLATAPRFDIVIMDPPWPNRSARRKKSYSISYNKRTISALLSSIPLNDHLNDNGLVGIWVTNKPAFHDLVLGQAGLFEQWGLELVEEWIWLKVTLSGHPVCSLDSTWKKPYEILLLGRNAGPNRNSPGDIKRRVIVGVSDLHSRKPNLKVLLEPLLPRKYEALEIFARNLTAGWWAWGNEVLKFQDEKCWAER